MNNYDEKRDFARMHIEMQVTYTVNNNETIYRGTSNDLSATGLAMTTDHRLEEGDKINIIMNAAGDRLPPFIAEGIILRVDASDIGLYDISASLTVSEET